MIKVCDSPASDGDGGGSVVAVEAARRRFLDDAEISLLLDAVTMAAVTAASIISTGFIARNNLLAKSAFVPAKSFFFLNPLSLSFPNKSGFRSFSN